MKTAVVACSESAHEPPVVAAENVFENLCEDPGQLDTLRDVDRLVLVLHEGTFNLADIQKAVRAIEVDPLGLEIVEIRPGPMASSLDAQIAGAVARASEFAGSRPEQNKPLVAETMTRRDFLRPLSPSYVAVPLVDQNQCVSSDGCRACVQICPQDAYQWRNGRIEYDMDVCIPCGRCVTKCPVGAISNPTITPSMVEAQIRAAIGASGHSIGIRFVCSRGSIAPSDDWIDVTVPCSSMVPATWLLACLLLGAAGATAVPCADTGCPLEMDDSAKSVNRLALMVIEDVDLDPRLVSGTVLGEAIEATIRSNLFAYAAAPTVIETLASSTTGRVDVVDPSANLGIVDIDQGSCTLCGLCAKTCPTDALREIYDDDNVSITFDPALCVNCAQCLGACPELDNGAISVIGRYDSASIAAGPRTMNEDRVATCEVCGQAFAPEPMMARISELLGPEFDATISVVGNRCLDCRGR